MALTITAAQATKRGTYVANPGQSDACEVDLNPFAEDPNAASLIAYLRENTAMPYASTLAEIQARAEVEMLAWITGFLAQFTAGIPDDEVKSWPRKAEVARTHLAGQPAPMILAEAAITGEDPNILARTIVAKANAYELIISTTSGLRRKTEAGIAAANSPEQVQAVLTAAKATAAQLAAKLGVSTS